MLDGLVKILPEGQRDKAKAWIAWFGTVVAVATLPFDAVPEWVTGIVVVLTALGVYEAPNINYHSPDPALPDHTPEEKD